MKIEPLIFVDGLIRRCNVEQIIIMDGPDKHTIDNPEISKEDDKCIKAKKYVHKGYVDIDISEDTEETEYKYELDNPIFRFVFQDKNGRDFENKPLCSGCAPYFFIIGGENGAWSMITDYEYSWDPNDDYIDGEYGNDVPNSFDKRPIYENITKLKYKCDSDDWVDLCCGENYIPGIRGTILFELNGKPYMVGGWFLGVNGNNISSNHGYPLAGDIHLKEMMRILGIVPFMVATGKDDEEAKADSMIYIDIEKMIEKNGAYKIIDLDREHKVIISRQLNMRLKEYNLCLSPEFDYIDGESKETNENYQSFSISDTRKLFSYFYGIYKDSYGNDVAEKEVTFAMSEFGRSKDDAKELEQEDLSDLVDKITSQSAKSGTNLSDYVTAVHEIGHSVAGKVLAGDKGITGEVTIIPDPQGRFGGFSTICHNEDVGNIESFENYILFCLASRVSEEMILKASSSGWSQDYRDAAVDIMKIICDYGQYSYDMDIGKIMVNLPNGRLPVGLGKAIDELIDRYYDETKELLKDKEDIIESMARDLVKEKTFDSKRFDELYAKYTN